MEYCRHLVACDEGLEAAYLLVRRGEEKKPCLRRMLEAADPWKAGSAFASCKFVLGAPYVVSKVALHVDIFFQLICVDAQY